MTISGFTIKSVSLLGAGIYVEANNCVIVNNNVENNRCGIYLSGNGHLSKQKSRKYEGGQDRTERKNMG
ncbi:MAG: hypothetical protein J7K36_10585 [Archaeoglobaceae archaeon]|nr:hypothetical protein [Archaeoglobaceae archaeon]